MNAQSISNRAFKAALISFLVAGLLAVMLLASMGTSWGVAYGQSAGPTNTPDQQTNAKVTPSNPTAVDNSGRQPTTAPSAVNDANQAPVGVVPGLPNTGTATQTTDDGSWKLIVLGLLLVNMLIAALVMRRSSKSSKSR